MQQFILGHREYGTDDLTQYTSIETADYEAVDWCIVEAETLEEARAKYHETFAQWQIARNADFEDTSTEPDNTLSAEEIKTLLAALVLAKIGYREFGDPEDVKKFADLEKKFRQHCNDNNESVHFIKEIYSSPDACNEIEKLKEERDILLEACRVALGYRNSTHHGDDKCLSILRGAIHAVDPHDDKYDTVALRMIEKKLLEYFEAHASK